MNEQSDEASVEEWNLTFHGTSYFVNMIASESLLILEIEDQETGERWSGEFTSQYIEEITHKAGNFKKFTLFVKMLSSAFGKSNESVYIDVLTLADLEMMKAKKLGTHTSGSSLITQSKSQTQRKNLLKRYAILTYTGEFDRVHYPLPLSFEETPNVNSLQRTIRRLREKLNAKLSEDIPPANERERELRQIVSQLRQENQELKHQTRQLSSRNGRSRLSTHASSSPSNHSIQDSVAAASDQLYDQNMKLKKQVDDLRKQLSDLSVQCEKIKVNAAKEVARWQNKLGQQSPISLPTKFDNARSDSQIIAELRHQVLILERELKLQRLSKGIPVSRSNTPTSQTSSRGINGTNSHRRAASASLSTMESARKRSVTSPASARSVVSRSSSPLSSSSVRSKSRQPVSKVAPNPSGGNQRPSPYRSQSVDKEETRGSRYPPTGSVFRNAHYNPSSSSLGGRFDPTAYQRRRKTQLISSSQSPRNGRYSSPTESGYSSASSQASKAYRASPLSDLSTESGKVQRKKKVKTKVVETTFVKRELFEDAHKTTGKNKKKTAEAEEVSGIKVKPSLLKEVSKRLEVSDRRGVSEQTNDENRINYHNPNFASDSSKRIGVSAVKQYGQFEERVNLVRKSIESESSSTRLQGVSTTVAKSTTATVSALSKPRSAPNSRSFDEEIETLAENTRTDDVLELNQRIHALNSYLESVRKNGISSTENSSIQSF